MKEAGEEVVEGDVGKQATGKDSLPLFLSPQVPWYGFVFDGRAITIADEMFSSGTLDRPWEPGAKGCKPLSRSSPTVSDQRCKAREGKG
jgi:hypothetical protein